jgi:ubiquinone biosynthesis protein COQ4
MFVMPNLTADSPSVVDVFDLPLRTRMRRAGRALGRLMRDPYDTQQVFEFSTNMNVGAIRRRLPKFFSSADGQRLYREDLSIDSRHVDLEMLARLPEGTLGREYVRFLRERQLTPDLFQAPENVHDPRAAYVMKRIRQSHDLWHLLTGHATNPSGEVALQAFTYGQPGTRAKPGAAIRGGRRAAPLGAVIWEDQWARPLVELRAQLGIVAVA